jgi:hypothetical protein
MTSTQIKNLGRGLMAAGSACLGVPLLQNQYAQIALIPPDWMRWFMLFGLIFMIIGPLVIAFGTKDE